MSLRTWWLEWQAAIARTLGPRQTAAAADWEAATQRWTANNAAKPRVCECGAPGVVQVLAGPGFMGDVAPAFWRCAAHDAVPLTVPWHDGVPQTGQTREECSWASRQIGDLTVTECGCGTHVGQERWR